MSGILVPERPYLFPRSGASEIKPACGNCLFSWTDTTGDLNCRRNPPTAFVMSDKTGLKAISSFPIVSKEDWCGHWAKENPSTTG